jgi:hypothetical protein
MFRHRTLLIASTSPTTQDISDIVSNCADCS